MNKFLNFLNKFEVSPFATIFIFLTLLTNSYKLFFIYFLITFIHELGHVLVAVVFKLRIGKIKLLAIGFNAEIDDLDYTTSLKEFLITIAGPLTYFISNFVLNYFYEIDFISYNALIQAKTINKFELIFNLLPMIPLDGGRILKIIIDNFITTKKSLYCALTISMIFTIIFIYHTRFSPQWMMYIFLSMCNIYFFLTIEKRWKLFLFHRLTFNNRYKIKIHRHNDIYRNKNNFLISGKNIIEEKTAIVKLIWNKK